MNAIRHLILLLLCATSARAATITIDGGQQFQRMDGFGVNVNTAWWRDGEVRPAIDLLVDQLGATLFRAVIEEMDWETANDNGDPFVSDNAAYAAIYGGTRFAGVWQTLQYLNQRGITDGLVISFMGHAPAWMGANDGIDAAKEDEFVETMVSLLVYARQTAGVQFTLVSPLNETDLNGVEGPAMGGAQVARVLRKFCQRLDAVGLGDVRLVAPEAAFDWNPFFSAVVQEPLVMAKMKAWGVHQYGGDAAQYLPSITGSAYPSVPFWVTEYADVDNLFGHLDDGAAAHLTWDGFDSVYQHAIRAGRGSTPPNDSPGIELPLIAYAAATGTYTPRQQFYEQAQFFRFVRPGARRIEADSANGSIRVYAYRNADGRLSIIGRNSGGALTLTGSLAGLTGITSLTSYFTNATQRLASGPSAAVTSGAFSIAVPANTIFTFDSGAPTAAPVFTPNGGNFATPVAVTMSSATAGAVIRYTTDGSLPGPAAATYTVPITISASATVRAVASSAGGLRQQHHQRGVRHRWATSGALGPDGDGALRGRDRPDLERQRQQ